MSTEPEIKTMRTGEVLDWSWNYKRELVNGDLLTATAGDNLWSATGAGLTLGAKTVNTTAVVVDSETIPAYMLTSQVITAVSAGTYTVRNVVTTAALRVHVKDFTLVVSD
jgi:hypothetical protein